MTVDSEPNPEEFQEQLASKVKGMSETLDIPLLEATRVMINLPTETLKILLGGKPDDGEINFSENPDKLNSEFRKLWQ